MQKDDNGAADHSVTATHETPIGDQDESIGGPSTIASDDSSTPPSCSADSSNASSESITGDR